MNKLFGAQVPGPRAAVAVLALLAWTLQPAPAPAAEDDLTGRLLVATPGLTDPNFARTVIYLVRHGAKGALGVVVNQPMGEVPLDRLLGTKKPEGEASGNAAGSSVLVHYGGPVEQRQAFILHSPDVLPESSVKIDEAVAFSRDRETLFALEQGRGPRHLLLALGYSGWAPGQLEAEIARDSWYVVEGDESLVFGTDHGAKWQRAIARHAPEL